MKNDFCLKEQSYFSYSDEEHFYKWLESIDGVENVTGSPQGLLIRLSGAGMSREGIYDLIALLTRYSYPMRFVRELVREDDQSWFQDPKNYWHSNVFGVLD